MPPRKFVSQEVLDSVALLVKNRKTDLQISEMLKMEISEIYRIRRHVLGISLYGSKRRCSRCGHEASVTCFSSKSVHTDWCIVCRREHGGEKSRAKLGRPFVTGEKSNSNTKYTEVICLRCDRVFLSEMFVGLGGRLTHFFTCEKCREIIGVLNGLSIDGGDCR